MKRLFTTLAMACIPVLAAAQSVVTVKDADIQGNSGTVQWTRDKVYLLDGSVFVEEGTTLEIEAGTVIKGKAQPTTGDQTSSLIIARGAKIIAEGTRTRPIIFTAEGDDVNDPTDIPLDATGRGLWGGVLVLGKATINITGGTKHIEGIAEEPRAVYGGTDDNDNSGILRYVSIRHGGATIGADNDINGLSLGGVGRGTQIDHIEIFANFDDGIEFFGGTVDTKYIITAFCGDDSYDYDEGFRGRGQFWFSLSAPDAGDKAGEHDGGISPEDAEPFSIPVIYNVTYIGSGIGAANNKQNALILRDNAGGKYYNSIITDFPNKGLEIEDLAPEKGVDSRTRFEAGDIAFQNNVWGPFGAGNTAADFVNKDWGGVASYLNDAANGNVIATDIPLLGVSRTVDKGLNPLPKEIAVGASKVKTPPNDGFFENVDYMGAFSPRSNWATGWTALHAYGILADDPVPTGVVVVKDADVSGPKVQWTRDKVYLLDGSVFVEEGTTLEIEAGTIIKGKARPTTGDQTSSLIVARGGKIMAEGTKDAPVIFTAEGDDVNDPTDIPLDATGRGLWGGVLVLGKATINITGGTKHIEGIAEEPRAVYGGTDDNDNSGILRYVSIRHGGATIGADNDINGLSLGGVGRGTQIDHIEIFANFDDGIEFFGGTVDTKYIATIFCGDDSYDYDEGFRGRGQFWFSLSAPDAGDKAGEHDGGISPEDAEPFSLPVIYNATYVGSGIGAVNNKQNALILRDNAGGKYYNSIITDFPNKGLEIEDLAPEKGVDSRTRFEAGDIVFQNNVWGPFGAGNTAADFVNKDWGGVATYLNDAANGNVIATEIPLIGISREADRKLNPSPKSIAIGSAKVKTAPNDGFFTQTDYMGAFSGKSNENWLQGWTAIDKYGILASNPTAVEDATGRATSFGVVTWPNPAAHTVYVRYSLPEVSSVIVRVQDLMGNTLVEKTGDTTIDAGVHTMAFDVTDFAAGTYYVSVTTNAGTTSGMVVITR